MLHLSSTISQRSVISRDEAGHKREPRVSVSRGIFALVDDHDRAYFGSAGDGSDQIGFIDANTRAIGCS
jgi:hypothetical protein